MGEPAQPERQRYITTHDPTTGQSVFDSSISSTVPQVEFPGGATLQNYYVSEGFPHQLSDNADLKTYQRYLDEPPGIMVENGTLVRRIDFKPGATSPMHRTLSIDFGVVLEGEISLELDSGESKLLKKGDVVVQRTTLHAWHNKSSTEVASMVFFIQPTAPLEVAGKTLAEEHRV